MDRVWPNPLGFGKMAPMIVDHLSGSQPGFLNARKLVFEQAYDFGILNSQQWTESTMTQNIKKRLKFTNSINFWVSGLEVRSAQPIALQRLIKRNAATPVVWNMGWRLIGDSMMIEWWLNDEISEFSKQNVGYGIWPSRSKIGRVSTDPRAHFECCIHPPHFISYWWVGSN